MVVIRSLRTSIARVQQFSLRTVVRRTDGPRRRYERSRRVSSNGEKIVRAASRAQDSVQSDGPAVLGRLAGNDTRLGTPDRHTFPPDGKPRALRPVNVWLAVSVAPTPSSSHPAPSPTRHHRSRARSPVPSPEYFA